MSLKPPPRPKTKDARIRALVERCRYIRKRMGLNRTKFVHFLNGQFLSKANKVSYRAVQYWEDEADKVWPGGEAALALLRFEEWATAREKSLGYFYMHTPVPRATHTIWDENLKPHIVPYKEPDWAKQVAPTLE